VALRRFHASERLACAAMGALSLWSERMAMRTETLVEALSQDLKPVRPRSVKRDAAILGIVAILEFAAFLGAGVLRPDMPHALHMPSFWWKLAGMGVVAISGVTVALLSADPTRSPRAGLRLLAIFVAAIFAAGWLVDAMHGGFGELVGRLDWQMGIECTWKMVTLSVPTVIVLGILIRRGAPTDRSGTSLAAALGSAGCGAFVFVFACPSDDVLYIAAWYSIGCGIVTIIGRSILARLFHW
jgi:hypothetical protein